MFLIILDSHKYLCVLFFVRRAVEMLPWISLVHANLQRTQHKYIILFYTYMFFLLQCTFGMLTKAQLRSQVRVPQFNKLSVTAPTMIKSWPLATQFFLLHIFNVDIIKYQGRHFLIRHDAKLCCGYVTAVNKRTH